jgi:hypothetical protein
VQYLDLLAQGAVPAHPLVAAGEVGREPPERVRPDADLHQLREEMCSRANIKCGAEAAVMVGGKGKPPTFSINVDGAEVKPRGAFDLLGILLLSPTSIPWRGNRASELAA